MFKTKWADSRGELCSVRTLQQNKADFKNEAQALIDEAEAAGRDLTKSEAVHFDSIKHKLEKVDELLLVKQAELEREVKLGRQGLRRR